MALNTSKRFGIYSGSFSAGENTLDLRQLHSQGVNAGSRFSTVRAGGGLNPSAHILSSANPSASFATRDLLTLLNTGNAIYVSITSGLYCSAGHTARYQQRDPGGAFKTGSDHMTQVTSAGFLNLVSLAGGIDDEDGVEAQLEYTMFSSDGLANPLTESITASLAAAPSPAFMSQYYMGPLYVNSVQAVGLTRVRIVPGIRFAARRADGGVFPVAALSSIVARDPSLEFTFVKADLTYEIGSFFTAALPGTLTQYFMRGLADSDGRVASATASHMKIDAAAGSWGADSISVVGENDTEVTIRVMVTGALALTPNVALP